MGAIAIDPSPSRKKMNIAGSILREAGGALAQLRDEMGNGLSYQAFPAWFQDWVLKEAEATTLKTAATEHHDAAQATRTEVANLKDELGQLRETMAGAIASAVAKEQQDEAALADLQRRHDILTEAMRRAAPPK